MSQNSILKENGLILKDGRLYGDPQNPAAAQEFARRLMRKAEAAEAKANIVTPYKARLLRQNARAGRRDARRILSTLN